MNIDIKEQELKTFILIDGRIDTTNAKEFETAILKTLEKDSLDIEIDCSKLSYISSSGLRVFLLMQKNITAKKGILVLKNMSNNILEIFKMTGFASIFKII